MSGEKTLTPERIAEIKAFKNTDFSDCPVLTEEELKKMRPRHPEYFKPIKKAHLTRLAIADRPPQGVFIRAQLAPSIRPSL